MERGVLFLASGAAYIDEAERSAASVKEHHPNLPISLRCDRPVDSDVFDDVTIFENSFDSMGDSILTEEHLPYDQTLYLDVDIRVCGSIFPIFEVLDKFDTALARDAGSETFNKPVYDRMDQPVPDTLKEFNSGVIAYNDCTEVRELFNYWNDIYNKTDFSDLDLKTNQPALTAALSLSEASFITLSPEYNFQLNMHRYARQNIKILHRNGRVNMDLKAIDDVINSYHDERVITLEDYPCRVISPNYRSMKFQMKKILSKSTWERLQREAQEEVEKDGIIPLLKFYLSKVRELTAGLNRF